MTQRKHIELFIVGADGERQPASDAVVVAAAKCIPDKKIGRRDVIKSPETAKDYVAVQMGGYEREVFTIIFLDAQNRVFECRRCSRGRWRKPPSTRGRSSSWP